MPGLFNVAVEALIEKDGKIFMAKRSGDREHDPNVWECLTGRVEQNESFEEAVKREVREETTLEVDVIEPINTFHFFRNPNKDEHQGVSFWCRYKSGRVILDPREHSEYKWVSLDEAYKLSSLPSIKRSIDRLKKRI